MNRKQFTSLLAALALTACSTASGPTQSSGIDTPSFWSRMTGSGDKAADLNAPLTADANAQVEQEWWKHFGDNTLDTLIAEALTNNKTLAIAKARVEEARANRGLARSALYPQINGVASATRGNAGYASNDKPVGAAEADVEATWELDLFGRNQARASAASALLESEEDSRQAVLVGLLAEVARNYFDMRNYERQIILTQQNLDTENKTLQLIQAQFQGALASDFDVQRAAAQVSTTQSEIPALRAAYDATLNRLSVLIGAAPGSKDAMLKTSQILAPLDQHIIVAAPAAVLAARPDVRAAERRFAAAISAKKAAKAQLFPDISLTGLFGLQTSNILSATPWSFGAGLTQPILNFGAITSQIDAADARQKQASLDYQQTVLEALENMENALSSYLNETSRNVSLTTGVAQNRKAADLAHQQYSGGYTGLLDVLVAERNVLDAESAQAASDASLRKDLVNIYAASGGGWNIQ